jgi:malate synthase
MPGSNQIDRKLQELHATPQDLLEVPMGIIKEAGLRQTIAAGIGYLKA